MMHAPTWAEIACRPIGVTKDGWMPRWAWIEAPSLAAARCGAGCPASTTAGYERGCEISCR